MAVCNCPPSFDFNEVYGFFTAEAERRGGKQAGTRLGSSSSLFKGARSVTVAFLHLGAFASLAYTNWYWGSMLIGVLFEIRLNGGLAQALP